MISEWLDTLACISADDVVYVDYVVAANRMCRFLRAKECEMIIALTHMRAPNDQRLAELAPDIDLILGGHDHDYYGLQVIGTPAQYRGGAEAQPRSVALFPHGMRTSRMCQCFKPIKRTRRRAASVPHSLKNDNESSHCCGNAACCSGGTPIVKSGTDFFDFTAIAIFPGDSSPQPNLIATALIDDSGQRVGAAAIAAAAIASAPRSIDGAEPAGPTASPFAAAIAVAEEASSGQSEELSPSELAAQVLHAKGKLSPDLLGQQAGAERALLLKPVQAAKSQSQPLLDAATCTRICTQPGSCRGRRALSALTYYSAYRWFLYVCEACCLVAASSAAQVC